jgi:alpha-tubulin suppressor-like RCC1 family protein
MDSTTPVQVVGITGAVGVSAGWRHACAVLGDGTVQCWGQNEFGQLGDGTIKSSTVPVRVHGITGAVAVTAGWWHHSCALLADYRVRCWGVNEWGQFGHGTTTSSPTPVTMTGTGVMWTSSNTVVATIDATGQARGASAGTTRITATDAAGTSASTTLTVRDRITLSVIPARTRTGQLVRGLRK